jgi:DNA-binding CsgD family transcriptional regulator
VLVLSDELDSGERWLARADSDTRRRGDVGGQVAVAAFRSSASLRRGNVREAVELAREAVEGVAAHELPVLAVVVATYAVDALIEAAELEEASAVLARLGLDGDLPDVFHFAAILSRRGRLLAARGMPEEGLADLLEAGRRLVRGRSTNPSFSRWRSHAAAVLAGLGRVDEARALADEELELARAVGQASSIGIAMRTVARLREPAEAVELLREAVDRLAASPDRLQEAHALADLGAALRGSGRRTEARVPLRRALEMAVGLGAVALADRAREELLAAGARPRGVALTGSQALTPSEARCARMAASGMANREIAHALFVSVRAVEMHLTSTYRKLGIASRRELAKALDAGD